MEKSLSLFMFVKKLGWSMYTCISFWELLILKLKIYLNSVMTIRASTRSYWCFWWNIHVFSFINQQNLLCLFLNFLQTWLICRFKFWKEEAYFLEGLNFKIFYFEESDCLKANVQMCNKHFHCECQNFHDIVLIFQA